MFTKIRGFFNIENSNLKKVSLIILLSYVFLVTLPFISTPIPFLWNITSNGGMVTVIYRAVISISFFAFFVLVALFNKLKPNLTYIIFASLLIVGTVIGFFAIPNSVIYGDGTPYNNRYFASSHFFHFSYYSVGLLTYLKSSSRLLFGLCFGYALLYIIPKVLDKKTLSYIAYFYFGVGILSCLFSIIFEFNGLISILKTFDLGGGIKSLYSSKNDFGSFLIIGCLSYLYLYLNKTKHYKLLFIPFVLLIIFGIVCGCKTSLIFSIVFITYFVYVLIKKSSTKSKALYFSLLSSVSVVISSIIIIIFLISFSNIPVFIEIKSKIDAFMFYNVKYTLDTRFQIWSLSFVNTDFFKVIFGQTWGYGPSHLEAITSYYIGTSFDSYHNSLIFIYSVSGLIGLVFYLHLIIQNIRITYYKQSHSFKVFISLCLSALLLFSLVEDDLIFLSGSGFSLFYSLVLSPIGKKVKESLTQYFEVSI